MFRRPLIAALTAAAAATIVPATLSAQPLPSIVAPTTTTTPPLVIVAPPTTTTTTTPTFDTPSTSTTTTPVIVTPSTTTTQPPIATPTSPTTTAPGLATPTSPTTTAPALAAPSTTATTAPALATPTTTTAPDEHGPDVPIGEIDTSGTVPDGLDLTAFPDAPAAPTAGGGGDGPTFSAGQTCFNQCIKSGVAYPRGFGALLVVETYVPADVWLGVSEADSGADGHLFADSTSSAGMVPGFIWALDHLEPGQTYYVVVAATDENGHTAYAYGEFTTLSRRAVSVLIHPPEFTGGPSNIVGTDLRLRVADLSWRSVDPPESIGDYYSLPRHLDLAMFAFRTWSTSSSTLCEGYDVAAVSPQGDSDGACGTWNTATIDDVDLDAIPSGRSQWTEVVIGRTLQTPTGDGGLPPGYGDPRYFDFTASVVLTVTYS